MLLLLKILLAIFTFTVGIIGVLYIAPLPGTRPVGNFVTEKPVDVTLADLAQHPASYDGRLVRVTAGLEFSDTRNATLTDGASSPNGVRLSCASGYVTCRELLADIRAKQSSVEITVVGRFFASVLESPDGGVGMRVPLVEIVETKGVKTKSGRPFSGSNYNSGSCRGADCRGGGGSGGRDADPVNDKGRGKGTGSGHGSGSGYGN